MKEPYDCDRCNVMHRRAQKAEGELLRIKWRDKSNDWLERQGRQWLDDQQVFWREFVGFKRLGMLDRLLFLFGFRREWYSRVVHGRSGIECYAVGLMLQELGRLRRPPEPPIEQQAETAEEKKR